MTKCHLTTFHLHLCDKRTSTVQDVLSRCTKPDRKIPRTWYDWEHSLMSWINPGMQTCSLDKKYMLFLHVSRKFCQCTSCTWLITVTKLWQFLVNFLAKVKDPAFPLRQSQIVKYLPKRCETGCCEWCNMSTIYFAYTGLLPASDLPFWPVWRDRRPSRHPESLL